MTQKGFVLDLDRCVGCHACIIACSNENNEQQTVNWREVHTFNEYHHPRLPAFNLSLSCNHCADPACLKNCPARAYAKDPVTGAVIHNSAHCIGCKYCTWVCPYDAPKINHATGTVEKCIFCHERLKTGKAPACASACPTGALQFEDRDLPAEAHAGPLGFPESDIGPSIRFIPSDKEWRVPECTAPPDESAVATLFKSILTPPAAKITLREEWPLLIFTTITSVLAALLAASLITPIPINPFAFLIAGVVGAILSVKHLGKKTRAYRSLVNFRTSWLSREIIAYSAFLGLTGLYLLVFPTLSALGWLGALFGFLALLSTDKSYQAATQVHELNFHSAQTLFTGLYLMGVLTRIPWLYVPFGLLKLVLYLYRKAHFQKQGRDIQFFASALRLSLGFLVPLALQFFAGSSGWTVVSVVIGEILDRLEFYDEMDVVSPHRQMFADLQRLWQQL